MPELSAGDALTALLALGDPDRAAHAQRYFKTGPGEYGEGDRFLGLRMPQLHELARSFSPLALADLDTLLQSEWHEARMLALLVLVRQYRAARRNPSHREALHRFCLDHTDRVNNWDLVDATAPTLVGQHLLDRPRDLLDTLAESASLWERRIAMVATQTFIRAGDFADTFRIAETLLQDREDLIHKATGWMLREVGNRSPEALAAFLDAHYSVMPRTMLRYAIEKLPEAERRAYLESRSMS